MRYADLPRLLRATLALVFALGSPGAARAVESGPYSIEILVRGQPLRELQARGRVYVEAREGEDYAVRLTNRTGQRIAIALAVDGLNSIDAKTTAAGEASRWILGPWETIQIEGWQTGSSTARRFFFTTEDRSYGAWLGRPANLGVISAAVFREKPQRIFTESRRRNDDPRASSDELGEARGFPAAPSEGRQEAQGEAAAPGPARDKETLSDDHAATGIGDEVAHEVQRVAFDSEAAPAAVLEVRYEFRDALVRLGVLPERRACARDPLSRRERARGFEESEFAPDPWARRGGN